MAVTGYDSGGPRCDLWAGEALAAGVNAKSASIRGVWCSTTAARSATTDAPFSLSAGHVIQCMDESWAEAGRSHMTRR